jgi:hypothetical protein
LPDYLLKESDLKTDAGVIQYASMSKYVEQERYGTVLKNCLDVYLKDKSYYVRFTDELKNKYWARILDKENVSKKIELKFQERLLQDSILYNPNEVLIDNKVIIPVDSERNFQLLILIIFTTIIIACAYFLLRLWQQYKEELYSDDKQISAESKWKLISTWIKD